MISHVVDASMFGPSFFDDGQDDPADLVADGRYVVPQPWRLEIASQMLNGSRRKRTTDVMADEAMAQWDRLPLTIDTETNVGDSGSFSLARKHGVTVCDAAYLGLAMWRRSPLVTDDKERCAAALAESMVVSPE